MSYTALRSIKRQKPSWKESEQKSSWFILLYMFLFIILNRITTDQGPIVQIENYSRYFSRTFFQWHFCKKDRCFQYIRISAVGLIFSNCQIEREQILKDINFELNNRPSVWSSYSFIVLIKAIASLILLRIPVRFCNLADSWQAHTFIFQSIAQTTKASDLFFSIFKEENYHCSLLLFLFDWIS